MKHCWLSFNWHEKWKKEREIGWSIHWHLISLRHPFSHVYDCCCCRVFLICKERDAWAMCNVQCSNRDFLKTTRKPCQLIITSLFLLLTLQAPDCLLLIVVLNLTRKKHRLSFPSLLVLVLGSWLSRRTADFEGHTFRDVWSRRMRRRVTLSSRLCLLACLLTDWTFDILEIWCFGVFWWHRTTMTTVNILTHRRLNIGYGQSVSMDLFSHLFYFDM